MKPYRTCLQIALTVTIMLTAIAARAGIDLPAPLVDAEWLADHIDRVTVLDVRKDPETFGEGHIANAILVEAKKIRTTRVIDGVELTRMLPEKQDFERFISDHGVSNDSTVVITHEGGSAGDVAGAARLYWQLRYYGFDSVALLDGGNRSWEGALEELVEEVQPVSKGNFTASGELNDILATTEQVEEAMKSGSHTLVDTRPLRFHIGLDKRDYVYEYGHIPGSKVFPYKFLHPEKGTAVFVSTDDVKAAFDSLDIDPASPIILYCNSAYECSSVWFMLHELISNRYVKIYDGSLHAWTMDTSRPMTTKLGQ